MSSHTPVNEDMRQKSAIARPCYCGTFVEKLINLMSFEAGEEYTGTRSCGKKLKLKTMAFIYHSPAAKMLS